MARQTPRKVVTVTPNRSKVGSIQASGTSSPGEVDETGVPVVEDDPNVDKGKDVTGNSGDKGPVGTNSVVESPVGRADEGPEAAKKLEKYKRLAATTTRSQVFFDVPFMISDEFPKFGSVFQKLVCRVEDIPQEDQQWFWENGGRECSLHALTAKRRWVIGAMRKQFMSKSRAISLI